LDFLRIFRKFYGFVGLFTDFFGNFTDFSEILRIFSEILRILRTRYGFFRKFYGFYGFFWTFYGFFRKFYGFYGPITDFFGNFTDFTDFTDYAHKKNITGKKMTEYICLRKSDWSREMVEKYTADLKAEFGPDQPELLFDIVEEDGAFVLKLCEYEPDCPRRILQVDDSIIMIVKDDPSLDKLTEDKLTEEKD
jgi:hypothetical protein